ncbi:MAG TPA: hypothetical protein VHE58_04520 [Burkholderiales bacterium]|nr:hypothetical protein [Burkholderiales bacterium]
MFGYEQMLSRIRMLPGAPGRRNWAFLGIGRAARVMALLPRILIYTWVSEMAAIGQKRPVEYFPHSSHSITLLVG